MQQGKWDQAKVQPFLELSANLTCRTTPSLLQIRSKMNIHKAAWEQPAHKHPSRQWQSHTAQPQGCVYSRGGRRGPGCTHRAQMGTSSSSGTAIPSLPIQTWAGPHSLAELASGNSPRANFFHRGASILTATPATLFHLVTILTVKSSNICVEMIWQ